MRSPATRLQKNERACSNGQLQDDFAKFVASKNATTYPDCFVCILRVFWINWLSSLIRLRLLGPRRICAAKTVPPPSQSSSCSAQPTHGLSRQADPRAVLYKLLNWTRGAQFLSPPTI
ncbi:hypothetical protein TNCV_2924951 [Trichonephila clavipes]|nr:hypothetical protein TNCV_2924951 [Trichonephila clavipes]